ncbi:MAG: radical SAM protein [Candidatus Margulisbacteria bacterium]|jgi:radical SAM protein with 4Fe4S-binding SPASM domain|nr:radical SAM protein [Candidatus Margulisiibacteriota bacterium]
MLENVYHLILTVTRDCNLHCQYCFEQDKQRYRQEKMTLECFQKFLDLLCYERRKNPGTGPALEICFHGGEPLLAGRARLQQFIDEAHRQLGKDRVFFSLQTNGTLLDKDWTDWAEKNNCHISISLDGYNYRANRLRFTRQEFARKNPLRRGVKISGVLALLTRNNLSSLIPFLLYLFHRHRLDCTRVNAAELVNAPGPCQEELTGTLLTKKFYIPLLRCMAFWPWFSEYHIRTALQDFAAGYLYTRDEKYPNSGCVLCGAKFCGAGNGIINLLPDGDLWACQRSLGLESYRLGSVYDPPDYFGLASFGKLFGLAYQMAQSIRAKRCDTCFAADICDHGCRAFALLKTQGAAAIRPEIACETYKSLKKYLGKDPYNHLVLFAFLHKFPVRKERSLIQIEIPRRLDTINGHHEIGWIRDPQIQIFNKDNKIWITFAKKRVSPPLLFWLTAAGWRRRSKRP